MQTHESKQSGLGHGFRARRAVVWTGLVACSLLLLVDVTSTWVGLVWSSALRADGSYSVFAVRKGRIGGGIVDDWGPTSYVPAAPAGWRLITPQEERLPFRSKIHDNSPKRLFVTLSSFQVPLALMTLYFWWRGKSRPTKAGPGPGDPLLCGHCGYDLSGIVAEVCPECGGKPVRWDYRNDLALQRLSRIHRWVASSALWWLVAANVAYFAACLSVGRPGMWNHPSATKPLLLLWFVGGWVLLITIGGPGALWYLIAGRLRTLPLSARAASEALLRTLLICFVLWALTIAFAMWDPLGAAEWMAD